MKWFFQNKRIYADYASGTPIDQDVFSAMRPFIQKDSFNPQGLYKESRTVHTALENARRDVARLCGVTDKNVVFTSGGTEANMIAILSLYETVISSIPGTPKILVSSIEHPSVLGVVELLKKRGCEIISIPVTKEGIVDVSFIEKNLDTQTVLVIVMGANNEIGTVQPISRIGRIVRQFRKDTNSLYPYMHSDIVQMGNTHSVQLSGMHVDSIALSGSKIYGPKGSGVWVFQGAISPKSWFSGGTQEFGFRPGTHNVSACIGFARALVIAQKTYKSEYERLLELRKELYAQIQSALPDAVLIGSKKERLPHNLYLAFPNISAEQLVIELDARGVAVSSQSACSTGNGKVSHVLQAITGQDGILQEGIRISLGRNTTKKDILEIARAVKESVTKLYTDRNRFLPYEKNT
ncbi:MAG: cysteine desulfurase [Candidatus Pacebacteria bacterium]|nr:cysteine desulfurase [Candidatus Paceibacterota bacterium]